MEKPKKSFAALLMYSIIALSAVVAIVCLVAYYAGFLTAAWILWSGIVAFMIMYHLWARIIMGNVSKLFGIQYESRWFSEKKFEKKLYKFLRVKNWKGKVLTYNPELFDVENHTFGEIANTMAKAETDHWINEVISLSSLLFSLIWGEFWIFAITAFAAMIFDAQFIVVQRYNRPRVLRILSKTEKRRESFECTNQNR